MTTIAEVRLPEAVAHRLAEALTSDIEVHADAVDMIEDSPDGWLVTAYFATAEPDRRAAVGRLVSGVAGDGIVPAWRRLPPTDWVKQSQSVLAPVSAGRFVIYGQHDRERIAANATAIHIEAGQAFGTGHHGTTRGCLLAIGETLRRRDVRRALDIGTGSGVLAIALAKSGVLMVATDVDPIAVAVARGNARQNGVAARIRTVMMPRLARGLARLGPAGGFDLVVANILMGPLMTLAPAIRRAISRGGTLILSGLLPHQRTPIAATYRLVGLRLSRWFVLDGWLTMIFVRPQRFRR